MVALWSTFIIERPVENEFRKLNGWRIQITFRSHGNLRLLNRPKRSIKLNDFDGRGNIKMDELNVFVIRMDFMTDFLLILEY